MVGPLPSTDRKAPEKFSFDPFGGTVVEEIVEEPASASSSEIQSPSLAFPDPAGRNSKVIPEAAATAGGQQFLRGTKVPESELGLQRAYFGAFNNFVLALPDTALNLVAYGAEKTGLLDRASANPQENRDILTRFFNRANYPERDKLFGLIGAGPPLEPATSGEKIAAAAGEGTALALPFIGATSAGARGGTYAGPAAEYLINKRATDNIIKGTTVGGAELGPYAQSVVKDAVGAFANAPARVTAAEILANTASGAAGQTEEEITGSRTGFGDLLGGFIPAVTTGAAKLAYKWAPTRNAITWAFEAIPYGPGAEKLRSRSEATIAAEMQKAFNAAKARGDLQEAQDIADKFAAAGTPLKLTPAELSRDPGLRVGQESTQRSALGDSARRNQERINTNKDTVQNFLDLNNPMDDAKPTAVVRKFQTAADEEAAKLSESTTELDQFGQDVLSKLPSVVNRATEGATIRKALQDAKDAKKAEMNALADELGLNEADPKTLFNPVKKAIRDEFFLNNDTDKYLPKVIRDFADNEETVISFQTWKRYRDKVTDELSSALANNQNSDVVNLSKFKERLDNFGNMFYKTNDNWLTFKQRYADEYAYPFERGVAYEVLGPSGSARPGDSRYITSDEAVAASFAKNVQNATDFMNLYRDKPEAISAMRNVILDGARDASMKVKMAGDYTPTIDADRLNTFINKNREVLDVLGLKDDLGNTQSLAAQFSKRAKDLETRKNIIKNDEVNKLLKKISNGALSPDEFIDEAIVKPSVMKTLSSRVDEMNDPALKEAFNQSIWTRVRQTNDISNPGSFMETLAKNERALRMGLGDAHYDNLKTAAKGMSLALFADAGVAGGGIDRITVKERWEAFSGISIASALNAIRATGQRNVSPEFLAFSFGGRFINARQRAAFDQTMERLMYDPEFAKTLAERAGPDNKPTVEQQKRLGSYLFNMGLRPDGRPYEEEPVEEMIPIPPELILAPGETFKPTQKNVPFSERNVLRENVAPIGAPVVTPQKKVGNISVELPNLKNSPNKTFWDSPAAGTPAYDALFPNDPLGAAIQQRATGQ